MQLNLAFLDPPDPPPGPAPTSPPPAAWEQLDEAARDRRARRAGAPHRPHAR